jgi:hypothetical protein
MQQQLNQTWHETSSGCYSFILGCHNLGNVGRRPIAEMRQRPTGVAQDFGISHSQQSFQHGKQDVHFDFIAARIITRFSPTLSMTGLLKDSFDQIGQCPTTDTLKTEIVRMCLQAPQKLIHDTCRQNDISCGN